ncbi:MAG TPA: hypothetical protein VIX37_16910 [Candidatus Sulfotelmatobacter sp.]
MESTPPEPAQGADYGLRRGILSPMETLAQSVSTMAPTTTPAATIPLVCALAGSGTWLAYFLATIAIFLVGLCIARYARHSASPGSLYTYASMTLSPWLSATVAWSLLLAYVATGSNPRSAYGSSDFDRTHVFNVSYVYELPKFFGASSFNGIFRERMGSSGHGRSSERATIQHHRLHRRGWQHFLQRL